MACPVDTKHAVKAIEAMEKFQGGITWTMNLMNPSVSRMIS